MQVKQITAEDTYAIRQQMLRPNKELSECYFKGDNDDLTIHLGAFKENHLVSVASFYFERHPEFPIPLQYRLRGMATLPKFQGQRLSSNLLETALPLIKQNQAKLLWCNARHNAIGFYERVGFQKSGKPFEIIDIGPHQLMFINIA